MVSCLKRALLVEYPLTLERMGYLRPRNLHGCNSLVSCKVGVQSVLRQLLPSQKILCVWSAGKPLQETRQSALIMKVNLSTEMFTGPSIDSSDS